MTSTITYGVCAVLTTSLHFVIRAAAKDTYKQEHVYGLKKLNFKTPGITVTALTVHNPHANYIVLERSQDITTHCLLVVNSEDPQV